ncbi:cardiolipin synthase [Sodalis-like secondary symbiont of Drepanosiphum platanoidis]|uniref:cardiolipin synthase n=1 Tax=Sodalis-like secondary symbiont of Drepanosiphum platanoidis TaxID=2994493 RepID=UPI003463AB1B
MTTFYFAIKFLFSLIYWLIIISVIIRIIINKKIISVLISWLLIIYIFPLIGIITYLLFGEIYIGKKRKKEINNIWKYIQNFVSNIKNSKFLYSNKISKISKSLLKLCKYYQGIDPLISKNIKLINNYEKYIIYLIKDINLAKKNIYIIFYIWKVGGLVDKVTDALILASKRGVSCRIILDLAGSINLFRTKYPKILKDSGIKIISALNINIFEIFLRRMDLRQHKKIILIDNNISYIGSMNMVDPNLFKKKLKIGQWIDIMVRIESYINIIINIIFCYDWKIETGECILNSLPNIKLKNFNKNKFHYTIQIIISGPGFPKEIIHRSLLISIYSANKQIVITTPYLIPSNDLLNAICIASQRGVKVHIIIPKKNNSILVKWASRVFFAKLLRSGVLIHMFIGGFLHTKSILIDKQLSLIGTVNLDMRSLWLNFEITLIVDNYNFGKNLAYIQRNYMNNSEILKKENWYKRPFWKKIIERFFYFLNPLL